MSLMQSWSAILGDVGFMIYVVSEEMSGITGDKGEGSRPLKDMLVFRGVTTKPEVLRIFKISSRKLTSSPPENRPKPSRS